MVVQKDIFWKAAIITLIVFSLGIFLGYFLESNRWTEIREEYKKVEIEWADAKLQSIYYQLMSPEFCEAAIKENLIFSDKVYHQGLTLEKYEDANRLTEEMKYEKLKYALLKLEFWLNSISLKNKCKTDYSNIIYFYSDEPSINEKAAQDSQSVILKNLKDKHAEKIMLIPLPLDMDIATINIIKKTYNINKAPTILIDEKIKLEGVQSLEDLENEFL
jgi:hypothetical protein